MLNSVCLMGRLTRDPELRRTSSGVAVASFSVAVERDLKPKEGERETDFFDVVAWRGTAEMISKYFGKGRMIVVVGRLQARTWTDKENNKRKAVEVIAESVYFGDSKKEEHNTNGGGGYGSQYAAPEYPTYPASDYAHLEDDDAQLPF